MELGRSLLTEATTTSEYNIDDSTMAMIESDLVEDLNSMLEYDAFRLECTEEDVFLIEQAGNIFVEYADLSRFAEANGIDAVTAVHRLIEHYDGYYTGPMKDLLSVNTNNFYVIVDINEQVQELLQEAKKGNKKSKKKCVDTHNFIQNMINNGIKFAKKKKKKVI